MCSMPPSYLHIGKFWNMALTSHSPHQNLLKQKKNMKSTKSSITEALPQEGSTWFIGKAILMLNRLGNQSQTWAMPWQCSKNIKTNKGYNPPYDSPSPITPPHPLLCLSSPHPSLPPSPIPGTWYSKIYCRTLLLLSHYLLPLSPWLLNPWRHPSPHGWTVCPYLPTAFYMPPSLKASWPIRHSISYSIFPPMTLSPSSLSSSRFTQPFTPFLPGPPGA